VGGGVPDAVPADQKTGETCSEEATHLQWQHQSTCSSHNNARSVLEQLIRLLLTNKLSEDQTNAVAAFGHQLFQTSNSTPDPLQCCSSPSAARQTVPSRASLLADEVVQQTVSRIRHELDSDALQCSQSKASMLADTVVQQALREISNDLVTSDILASKPASTRSAQTIASSTGADCPPAVCSELTKYIVMNAIDIALSCARRAAAKRAGTDAGRTSPSGRPTASRSLIDVFIDRLSNEVYDDLSASAGQPTPDAILSVSRWIDDELRRQCLAASAPAADRQTAAVPSNSPSTHGVVSPFAEVLMNLALHDRLGDLRKNFVDGREMIELATRVLKSHVQSRSAQHVVPDGDRETGMSIDQSINQS